jgi:deoxyadenosine/deoxycytidine kinase
MPALYKELLNKVATTGGFWQMIVIDGVVGVGKSTFMKLLAEKGYVAYPEPVLNNPILEKFYYDRKRYSFPLQVFFLNKRFKYIKEASRHENAVMDRSIYGDVIFAKMLKDSGEMSEEEFELYKELLSNMLEHVNPPKLMVYLEVSVDEAIRRIQKRGRPYEQIVERSYWEKLNSEYQRYFESYDISPILKINVDGLDFENVEEDRKYVLSLIEEKLKSIE